MPRLALFMIVLPLLLFTPPAIAQDDAPADPVPVVEIWLRPVLDYGPDALDERLNAELAPQMDLAAVRIGERLELLGFRDYVIVRTEGGGSIAASGLLRVTLFNAEADDLPDLNALMATVSAAGLLEFVDFAGVTEDFEGQRVLTTAQAQRLEALVALGGELDDAAQEAAVNPRTGQPFQTVMTGDGLSAAVPIFREQVGQWVIAFEISDDHEILAPGFESFGDYTEGRAGEPMAIVLDGVVLSAPVINSRIESNGEITGNFTEDEAWALAAQLRTGVLPLSFEVLSVESLTLVAQG